jgi:hypothetical protein
MVHSMVFSLIKLDIVDLKPQKIEDLQNLEKETALAAMFFFH